MKAILIVFLFLGLLAALSAQWVDALIDTTEVQQAFIQRLQRNRKRWGQLQYRKVMQAIPREDDSQALEVHIEPLNIAPLFVASVSSVFSPQEVNWLLGIFSKITHKALLNTSEEEIRQLWEEAWQTVATLREQSHLETDLSGYAGRVNCFQDLLAIPLSPESRERWCELFPEQSMEGRKIPSDFLILDPEVPPSRIGSLQLEILEALFGAEIAQELLKTPPEQRGSLLASKLQGWQISALHRMVTW